jgi:DDE superfamily endonuclease
MDNFAAHATDDVLAKLKDIQVIPLFLPPNTTALLQPLDVTLNRAFKSRLQRRLLDRDIESMEETFRPGPISRQEITALINDAWEDIPP